MREYHKIETLFERDMTGSKKLIEGKFRSEAVEFLANNKWVFTEKIDGTNIRVYWNGHKVTFGSRTDRRQIPAHLVNKLNELFATPEAEELFEQKFGEKEVYLMGEGYGVKIQSGGAYRSDVSFILFDVMIGENYQPRKTIEEIAECFGIDAVPIVLTGTIQEGIDFVKSHPASTFGTAKMEGIVGRPEIELKDRTGKRVIVKIKAKDF